MLLSVGLFKKVILADGIADYVTPIFTDAAAGKPVTLLFAWAGAIGFTMQMYFDFSGYSEMALGLARMVGIKLPMNFNSPLKALSIVDYWSRWHITLTRFLTAYVYNPIAIRLARRRAAAGKNSLAGTSTTWSAFFGIIAAPTLLTMFLSGLWHGAGDQFLVFGLLHGVALVVNHAWRLARPRFWPDTAHYHRTTRPIAWALTFLVVIVALTWFHAASVAAGGDIVAGMTGLHGLVLPETIAARPGLAHALGHFGLRFAGADMSELAILYGWIAVLLASPWCRQTCWRCCGPGSPRSPCRPPPRRAASISDAAWPHVCSLCADPDLGVRDGRDHGDWRVGPEPGLGIPLLAVLNGPPGVGEASGVPCCYH